MIKSIAVASSKANIIIIIEILTKIKNGFIIYGIKEKLRSTAVITTLTLQSVRAMQKLFSILLGDVILCTVAWTRL